MLASGLPGTLLFGLLVLLALRGVLRVGDGLRQRTSVIQVCAGMMPQYLFMNTALPGNWGPFVLQVPLLFAASLSVWHPEVEPAGPVDDRPEREVPAT